MSDVTDAVAHLVEQGTAVPAMLLASVAALIATAGFRTRWSRRHGQAPPADDTGARPPSAERAAGPAPTGHEGAGSALWRMRTTVRDAPGSLAVLCAALAGRRIDILSLQTHPLAEGTVDEFLLRAPGELSGTELAEVVTAAGGARTWTERADAHDLVDAPTRILGLATRTALDTAELPLALRQLLGRCTIRSLPPAAGAGAGAADVPPEGTLEDTVLRLRAPEGGVISSGSAPHLPFHPGRVRAGPGPGRAGRPARSAHPARPGRPDASRGERHHGAPRRHAGRSGRQGDARAVLCADPRAALPRPGPDADRYLNHLLSPRFGRTLAVQTASGRIVGLGHLLWDGDETEVALLVEDAWQRRGIGGELLGRLVAMAAETGCESVYAVPQASNTGMVAAMRGLGLPLDYQIEEGTLVVTARLAPAARPGAGVPHEERIGRE
ncbi:GNAT family N-acetyltransferase OS=Streptomyces tendae OX=1932 GN=GUR47_30040 PE=4 SV=1 [Streptomyces tendae]